MGKPISQPTICRALKKIRTTYKKSSYQALEQLRKKNLEKIKEFIEVIIPKLLKSDSNIFFLDECSFNCNSAPRRGYSRKGSCFLRRSEPAGIAYMRPWNREIHYVEKDYRRIVSCRLSRLRLPFRARRRAMHRERTKLMIRV